MKTHSGNSESPLARRSFLGAGLAGALMTARAAKAERDWSG